MKHIDVRAGWISSGRGAPWTQPVGRVANDDARAEGSVQTHALVHIIEVEEDVRLHLTHWLPAGIELQAHASLEEFLCAHRVELPGCLVIDAAPLATPQPPALPYPGL